MAQLVMSNHTAGLVAQMAFSQKCSLVPCQAQFLSILRASRQVSLLVSLRVPPEACQSEPMQLMED